MNTQQIVISSPFTFLVGQEFPPSPLSFFRQQTFSPFLLLLFPPPLSNNACPKQGRQETSQKKTGRKAEPLKKPRKIPLFFCFHMNKKTTQFTFEALSNFTLYEKEHTSLFFLFSTTTEIVWNCGCRESGEGVWGKKLQGED